MRNMATTTQIDPPGLSPKKTLFIMVTVVGCIAILWPKVFYPMMFGGSVKQNIIKDHRGGTEKPYKSACCEVILDKDAFLNDTVAVGEHPYRKHINLYTGEISLRQERPPHLRPDTIHPAMRERGRAIPATPTVPIVERARAPSSPPPRVVEGRPGPIPGMRPPLGAGSVHQAPQKTSSMGFIMPLYTVGIVAFFIYTIMKILFKKPVPNSPYGGTRSDPSFHKEVFGHEKSCCSGTKLGCNHHNVHNRNFGQKHVNGDTTTLSYNQNKNYSIQNANANFLNSTSIITTTTTITTTSTATTDAAVTCASDASNTNGYNGNISSTTSLSSFQHNQYNIPIKNRERDQLMEIEKLRKKLEETERAMAQLIAEMNCDRYKAKDIPENIQQQNTNNNISNGHANPIQSSNDHLSNTKFSNDTITEKHQQQQTDNLSNNNDDNNDDNLLQSDNKNNHHHHHHQLLSDDNKNQDDNHLNYYNNNEETNENLNIDNENTKNTIETTIITEEQQHQHQQHQHQQNRSNNNENKLERKNLDDHHSERSVVVLGMELTASCEGGQKWNRPPTPVFIQHVEHSTLDDDYEKQPDPQPIYLEGALPHESQILVADSKIEKEDIILDDEYNDGNVEEPAVVLSSKMTLSLINLNASDNSDENNKEDSSDKDDSPLDNDMEIINREEQEDNKREQVKEDDEK